MPENPLLPHRKLRELHSQMLSIRALEKRHAKKPAKGLPCAREALLAATAMQLEPGDLLCPQPGDAVAASLAPATRLPASSALLNTAAFGLAVSRLGVAAAAAQGLQAAATKESPTGLVLAYTNAGAAELGWSQALAAAQTTQSPLLLAVSDATGGRSTRADTKALLWQTITPVAKRLQLPVLTVDGDDAVAVYRVMQESILRARFGGGPAVLWAVHATGDLPRSQTPLARLERYLKVRAISLR